MFNLLSWNLSILLV